MKRVTFDEIDAVECRIKSAFLKEKESECNQKGAEKEPKKGAEKRSRKKEPKESWIYCRSWKKIQR